MNICVFHSCSLQSKTGFLHDVTRFYMILHNFTILRNVKNVKTLHAFFFSSPHHLYNLFDHWVPSEVGTDDEGYELHPRFRARAGEIVVP